MGITKVLYLLYVWLIFSHHPLLALSLLKAVMLDVIGGLVVFE